MWIITFNVGLGFIVNRTEKKKKSSTYVVLIVQFFHLQIIYDVLYDVGVVVYSSAVNNIQTLLQRKNSELDNQP